MSHRPVAPNRLGLTEGGLIIGYVAVTHLSWAVALACSGAALMATPVAGLSVLGPRSVVAAVLGFSAIGSGFALWTRRPWVLWFLVPQQVILMLSFGSAVQAVSMQSYADGVVRPGVFIAADQAPTLLLAAVHMIAVAVFAYDVHLGHDRN